jgi:hypothetical protein
MRYRKELVTVHDEDDRTRTIERRMNHKNDETRQTVVTVQSDAITRNMKRDITGCCMEREKISLTFGFKF